MDVEWTTEKEAEFERLKKERLLERKRINAQKHKEKAKIRRDRYRQKMASQVHQVGFQMDKTIYDIAKNEGTSVGRALKEVSEAIGIFAIQNGTTFQQAVAETIAKISPACAEDSSEENPQIDESVIDALSN